MRKICFVLIPFFLAALASAQAPDFGGTAQKEAIKKMSFMVGEWAGSGWADVNGTRRAFNGEETILSKCDGALLSLEGNHSMDIQGRKIPIHNAFGFLRYDDKTKKYHMRAHLANGLESEYEFTGTPNGYTWSQDHPTWGHVVYTAVFTDKTWVEYGETAKAGKKIRVYEMNLTRKPAK